MSCVFYGKKSETIIKLLMFGKTLILSLISFHHLVYLVLTTGNTKGQLRCENVEGIIKRKEKSEICNNFLCLKKKIVENVAIFVN